MFNNLTSIIFSVAVLLSLTAMSYAGEVNSKTNSLKQKPVEVVIDGKELKLQLSNKQASSQINIKGELYEVKLSRVSKQCAFYVCR